MIEAYRTVLALPARGTPHRRREPARASHPDTPRAEAGRHVEAVLAPMPARYRARRPDAAFLTQVIATAAGLPQTRARRQCDPQDAAAAYAATARCAPVA